MVAIKAQKKDRFLWSFSSPFLPITLCGFLLTLGLFLSYQDGSSNTLSIRGASVGVVDAHSAKHIFHKPHLVYGTAWKKDETARLVFEAVKTGFRFIDTACQPKHYNEAGVGNGWKAAAQELGLARDDLWLQTKFTPFGGQDPKNIPYDPKLPPVEQARTSLEVSLKNLHTDYLDSWVLHSPLAKFEETMAVWRFMEDAIDAGKVRQIGISNCYDMKTFQRLYEEARHKPAVLQNRFYAETNFDTDLRTFCKEHNIHYQSFWTLTANRKALSTPEVKDLAKAKGLTPQTYLYSFLMSLGYVTPLSGTTSRIHMSHDVAVMERMQGGEELFSLEEQQHFADLLGMPKL